LVLWVAGLSAEVVGVDEFEVLETLCR